MLQQNQNILQDDMEAAKICDYLYTHELRF